MGRREAPLPGGPAEDKRSMVKTAAAGLPAAPVFAMEKYEKREV